MTRCLHVPHIAAESGDRGHMPLLFPSPANAAANPPALREDDKGAPTMLLPSEMTASGRRRVVDDGGLCDDMSSRSKLVSSPSMLSPLALQCVLAFVPQYASACVVTPQ